MRAEFVFNSESVTEGHPDKLCDQISDAIVGAYLQADPLARLAAECCISTGILFLAVKSASKATLDVARIAREITRDVGYRGNGFDATTCTVLTSLSEARESKTDPRIDEEALDEAEIDRIEAREQVTSFGYACDHTPAYMPLPIWLAHRVVRVLDHARQSQQLRYLSPDGKVQVGVEFRDGRPKRIHGVTLVASQKHANEPKIQKLREELMEAVILPAFSDEGLKPDPKTKISINPHGPMIEGGPSKHSGLTGRKTGMDTYGEFARHSGAALSGKDPSRIDRSASYAARSAAKHVVAAGWARQCEVQLSYVIGQSHPASVQVETFGTALVPDEEIGKRVVREFEFRPAGIVKRFGLRRLPLKRGSDFYQHLAVYGQMGRMDLDLPWERLDRLQTLTDGLKASA